RNRAISSWCCASFIPRSSRSNSSTYKAWFLLLIFWTFDAFGRRQGQENSQG
ncbi:hypothetical protein CCACVL1_01171, partial [Corchorus capsularis]